MERKRHNSWSVDKWKIRRPDIYPTLPKSNLSNNILKEKKEKLIASTY